jgi:hypothetical protein
VPGADVIVKVFQHLHAGGEIRLEDRPRWGIDPTDVEAVLEVLVKSHGTLLRGSGATVRPGSLIGLHPKTGWGYATDHAGVALLHAVLSNEAPRHLDKWAFPLIITPTDPLVVRVVNPRPGFQRMRGFVYLVNREGFRNSPVGSWQWITTRTDRRVLGRVEVQRREFHYPVETTARL